MGQLILSLAVWGVGFPAGGNVAWTWTHFVANSLQAPRMLDGTLISLVFSGSAWLRLSVTIGAIGSLAIAHLVGFGRAEVTAAAVVLAPLALLSGAVYAGSRADNKDLAQLRARSVTFATSGQLETPDNAVRLPMNEPHQTRRSRVRVSLGNAEHNALTASGRIRGVVGRIRRATPGPEFRASPPTGRRNVER